MDSKEYEIWLRQLLPRDKNYIMLDYVVEKMHMCKNYDDFCEFEAELIELKRKGDENGNERSKDSEPPAKAG